MADHEELPDDWGNTVARKTFIWTMILAVLTIGSVFVFIMR